MKGLNIKHIHAVGIWSNPWYMIYVSNAEVIMYYFTHPYTPIKCKIGGKKPFTKTCQNKILSQLFNSVKFSLRPKKFVRIALVAFKLSVAFKYLKKEGMTYQQA